MSKFPTAWRVHRTLAKCVAFKRGAVAVQCNELGKAIGVLFDPVDEPLLSVFDDGVVLHPDRATIRYQHITGVTARERRAEDVTGLVIRAGGRTHTVEITTMTGRFKDIFEVHRFLLRCMEDRQPLDESQSSFQTGLKKP